MDFIKLSLAGFDEFVLYFGLAIVFVAAYLFIYMRVTPYAELKLIAEGNTAAAASLSGSLIGFVLPLAAAIQNSVHPWDMMLWAGIALVVQVLVYVVVRMTLLNVARHIPEGQLSAGVFLGAVSIAAGLLNAACMSY